MASIISLVVSWGLIAIIVLLLILLFILIRQINDDDDEPQLPIILFGIVVYSFVGRPFLKQLYKYNKDRIDFLYPLGVNLFHPLFLTVIKI